MTNTPATILSYANARGGQPLGSTFAIETFDDGVELTKLLEPDRLQAAAVAAVAVVAVGITLLAGVGKFIENQRYHDSSSDVLIVMTLVLAISGYLLWYAVAVSRPPLLAITLRGRQLTTRNAVWTLRGGWWTAPRPARFAVAIAGLDVLGRRVLSNVNTCRPFPMSRTLIRNLPRDEAVWMVGLLKGATVGRDRPGDDV